MLLLGFRGRYQDPESDERQHLIAMFSKRVEPFRVQEDSAVLNVPLTVRQHYLWQSPFAGCYANACAGWRLVGLHSWLNVLVDELLPTGKS